MSDDFDCNLAGEDKITSSDHEELMDDEDDLGTKKYTCDGLPSGELSAEILEQTTCQFSQAFVQRYPSSGVQFCIGSLDDALERSIYNLENLRPLILYIRHNQSLIDNIFCEKFFCSKEIVHWLNNKFVIWPWDQTNANYYEQFLQLLIEKLGSKVASEIHSYMDAKSPYPWLVCLAKEEGQFTVLRHIDSNVVEEEMMATLLSVTRADFNKLNDSSDRRIGGWYTPDSRLTIVSPESDEF